MKRIILALIVIHCFFVKISYAQNTFQWPEGVKMGLSLTFDDARLTQVDKGIPLFDKYGVKATFYVSPDNMLKRMDGWKKAVRNGHDVGNHSLVHPCSRNYGWPQEKALENYTLSKMASELVLANKLIKDELGVALVSFAYPCGQDFVGSGANTKSYVPVVASLFETGRRWRSERPNYPASCDFAQLNGMEMDGKSFNEIKKLIEFAKEQGAWLILAGHEIGEGGEQTTLLSTLDSLCKYATNSSNGIWVDNVHNIASYIKENRVEPFFEMPVYQNSQKPIDERVEALLARMTLEEKIGQLNAPIPSNIARKDGESMMDACRKFVEGTLVQKIGPAGGIWATHSLAKEGVKEHAEINNELQKIAMEKTRLKIPLLFFEEGTHGLLAPDGTVFPEGLSIGSTWDTCLVRQVYSVVAREGRSRGIHFLGTLVVEPNRDPRLGRNEEGYSEDPYLCSQITSAIVEGMQGKDISANDKAIALLCHFPGQSEPVSGLERGAMEISERKLRETFLPPWISGIKKAGAMGVMATYPTIDGVPVHTSEKLLTKILREELGFEGLVMCEGGGLGIPLYEKIVPTMKESGALCLESGVDVSIWYEDAYLTPMWKNVKEGKVSMADIDRAVRRILKVKFMLGLFENPYVDVDRAVRESNTNDSRELALQTAREGMVLLKNENGLLPLDKNIKSIAVIGPNADNVRNQLGDYTPTPVLQDVVTVLEGIKKKVAPRVKVSYVKGCEVIGNGTNETKQAVQAAKKADVAIVVVGESHTRKKGEMWPTDGEGYDVASLDLNGIQEELIKAVHATGTPTVVVLINGRPLSIRWVAKNVPAILEAWNCGEEGGNAVADILFGDYNPEGHLPITVPLHVGQLPVYYNYMPSKAYWAKSGWGEHRYVDMPATPLWEFGYGLSYTTFEYSNLRVTPTEIGPAGEVNINVDVKNTGSRKGREVVQLYINDEYSSVSTPVKELKGFEKISLAPGEKKTVRFRVTSDQLSLLDINLKPVVEPGTFSVMVGSSSEDIRLSGKFEMK